MLRFSKGFTIIELLVTTAVLGIAMVGLTRMQVLGMRANKSSAIRLNALDVKRTITNSLSCEKTFESFGPTRPIACTGPVTLKDKNGSALTKNDKIDEWTIEASCESLGSPPTNGLSIYAIQPGKTDPLRGIPLDKNHPSGTLFSREVRLCRDYFKPAPTNVSLVPASGLACVKINSNTAQYPSTAPACNSGICCAAMCPDGFILTGGGVTGQDVWASLPLDSMTGWYGNFTNSATNQATLPRCNAVCCKIP
jgi:prepilin-type N-terminal cleavage/methylation domain-containing protein